MNSVELQQKTFLLLLVFVTVAFGWILLPFYGAVFWGSVLAIIFTPFHRRLLVVMNQRQNLAALTTLLLCLIIVILPVTIMTISLLQEGSIVYQGIRSGQLNFGAYFQQIMGAMPPWVTNVLDRLGLTNISELQDMLSTGALQGSQFIAMHALSIGQNAFEFVISFGIMLYLLFFLLRDGAALSIRIKQAIPLSMEHKRHLFSKFTTVIRATVKGNVVVAAAQGTLGGIMFSFLGIQGALLWGFVMAFLSLLPAVGAGLIWVPVAIYFLFTGAVWQGVTLIAFGVLVIGLVDNILRPILVGRDTKIPDYVILISTLGGMVLFGLNGFVIGPVIAALFIAAWDLFSASKEAPAD
ncbi:Predicted PurR-regulated permease PerM [Nitrosospira sp. Nsp11]|uniref:AI-2E family transporter n=1 Tax=Nitrosospira sp. Nsp11 TaxID=1855338 RepID=UPI000910DA0B|nr:AI-2E family transporter [Nitrosospira sp. Nsp11]SHL51900.1 Predicted PurR-regulated permease PerM [Nitrosospira sp. Nsp11]